MTDTTITTLQDNLRKTFNTIDREKLEALQAPNANPDQINLTSIRKYSACYVAHRAALARLARLEARS
jgi:hypothetical protein